MPKDTKLYDILGITTTANENEIKKAYYKQARIHHPDKIDEESQKPEAEEKFKEIKFAYEVLTDQNKREKYDRYGLDGIKDGSGGAEFEDLFSSFFGGGGGRRGGFFHDLFGGGMAGPGRGGRGGKRRTKNIIHILKVTLEEMYTGTTKTIELDRWIVCCGCKGTGSKSGASNTCKSCDGQGFVTQYKKYGPMIQQIQVVCRDCNGDGEIVRQKDKCKTCLGKKTSKQKKNFEVHVDKGMKDGYKLTFRGESHQEVDVETGDLIIVIQQAEHDVFTRVDNDLYMTYKLNITEALCGFNLVIRHLDGRSLVISNSAGCVITPNSQKSILKEGMPIHKNPFEKGNLYIKFEVEFPENNFIPKEAFKKLEAFLPAKPNVNIPKGELVEEVVMVEHERAHNSSSGPSAHHYRQKFFREHFGQHVEEDDEDDDEEDLHDGERVECATH